MRFVRLSLTSVVLFLALTSASLAHRDLVLPIMKDGTIIGLPEPYASAKLDIQFTPTSNVVGRRIDSLRLTIGTHATTFPKCLVHLLETQDMSQVLALGSTTNDPHFTSIYMKFYGPGYDRRKAFNNYVWIEFALRTAKIVSIMKATVGPAVFESGGMSIPVDKALAMTPVNVRVLCPHENLSRFIQVRRKWGDPKGDGGS